MAHFHDIDPLSVLSVIDPVRALVESGPRVLKDAQFVLDEINDRLTKHNWRHNTMLAMEPGVFGREGVSVLVVQALRKAGWTVGEDPPTIRMEQKHVYGE